MNHLICISICVIIALISFLIILSHRNKIKRTIKAMNTMLDSAINGNFSENSFDESSLSALESKLSSYLAAGQVSAAKLTYEQGKIKELISDISHQTKTPIASLLLYAQLLEEQHLSVESKKYVDALSFQTKKLHFLMTALINASRMETGILKLNPKRGQVKNVINEVLAQIAPISQKKGIYIEFSDSDATAFFDSKWTAEALYNIVDNAVKYTETSGTISITCCPYEMFCRIDISDTGMGIDEEEQSKIFGRFYRSPKVSQTEGVGIGLYLSREIIACQGGYLKVVSDGKNGSTFSIFLTTAI